MDEQRNSPTSPGPDQLPDLARDLARLSDPHIEVPSAVDDAVMAAARTALARRRRGGHPAFRWGAWTAAAAGLVLAVWVGSVLTTSQHAAREMASMSAPMVAGDLDRSGEVTILDAFALARQIEAGESPFAGDINSDGHIDRADVDALAMLAVRLPEGAS
ncbi:MAG: dockerin type I domain-containing protein [Planctomycetota bacterium]|jgi:hypothetical protein